MIEEAMSITPIIFILIILLFGFDSTEHVRTQLGLKIAREISNSLKYRSSHLVAKVTASASKRS
jgi:hypothetical protein